MPVLIAALVIAGASAVYLAVPFILAHLVLILAAVLGSGSTIIAALVAISRGTDKRNARRWVPRALPPPAPRPRLPRVHADYTWEDLLPDPPAGEFSSGEAYDPVTLVSSESVVPCESPDCDRLLPERPWQCGTAGGKDRHSFCSRRCLEEWIKTNEAQRERAGHR